MFVDFSKAFDFKDREKREQIILAIMILNSNTKVKVHSLDWETNFFNIVAGVLQGDTLTSNLFITCLDYVLRTLIDLIKENGFALKLKK